MDTLGWIVLIFIIFLIIGINAWLVAILRGKSSQNTSSMWKNAAQRIRNPWEAEDRDVNQLSSLVAQLKQKQEKQNTKENSIKD